MEDARIANVRNTVAGPNAISRFTFNREAEIDDKLAPVSIGALMVRQKQGDAWKLLHDKGSRVGGFNQSGGLAGGGVMKIRDCSRNVDRTKPNKLGPIMLCPGCGEWQMLHCDLKTRAPGAASRAWAAPACPQYNASIPSRNECRMRKDLTAGSGSAVRIPVAVRAVDAIGGALFRRAKIFPAMDALCLRV